MTSIKTPILIFKAGHKQIYSYDFAFMADKSLVSFYNKTIVIDSDGKVFNIESAERKGKIKIWQSLKSLSLMVEVEPKISSIESISLDQLKDKVFEHVSRHPKHWTSLDTLDGIKEKIYSSRSHADLIRIFR